MDVKIDDYEKSSTFAQVLRLLKKVRNKCCHTKKIYDFVTKNNNENIRIIKFLNLNDVYGVNSLNKINIWGVIECISFLNGKNLEKREAIKERIISMLNLINFELLPNDIRLFMKKQFRMNFNSIVNFL